MSQEREKAIIASLAKSAHGILVKNFADGVYLPCWGIYCEELDYVLTPHAKTELPNCQWKPWKQGYMVFWPTIIGDATPPAEKPFGVVTRGDEHIIIFQNKAEICRCKGKIMADRLTKILNENHKKKDRPQA